MFCNQCGLTWDMNDPDPPLCGQLPKARKLSASHEAYLKAMRAMRKLLAQETTDGSERN